MAVHADLHEGIAHCDESAREEAGFQDASQVRFSQFVQPSPLLDLGRSVSSVDTQNRQLIDTAKPAIN